MTGFTPTVGLGCRSGGYLVYLVTCLGLLLIEIIVWTITHRSTHTSNDLIRRVGTRLERDLTGEKGLPRGSVKRRLITYLRSAAFRDVVKNLVIRPLEVKLIQVALNQGDLKVTKVPGMQYDLVLLHHLCSNFRSLPDKS